MSHSVGSLDSLEVGHQSREFREMEEEEEVEREGHGEVEGQVFGPEIHHLDYQSQATDRNDYSIFQ